MGVCILFSPYFFSMYHKYISKNYQTFNFFRSSNPAKVLTLPASAAQQTATITQAETRQVTLPFNTANAGQVTSTESPLSQVPQMIKEETVPINGEVTIDNSVSS